ncbi:MAG: ATPase [Vicinamibacterales bacterium]
MFRMLAGVLCLLALSTPASAEVVDAQPNGFSLKYVYDIGRPREAVYRAIFDVSHWWDASHSYSGQAGNLSLDARAGGCFCERLPGGGVQHMLVIHANAPGQLTLQGGLGPLASLGVAGSMQWTLTDRAGGTHLEVTYNIGGFMPGGLSSLAPVVDQVVGQQVQRLKTFVETGRPE